MFPDKEEMMVYIDPIIEEISIEDFQKTSELLYNAF